MTTLSLKRKMAMVELGIPEHMHGSVIRYVENGLEPGHFLSAVITNDLRGAVGRADAMNVKALDAYVKWFYNYAPSGCWGSTEALNEWVAKGGMEGSA